MAIAMVSANIWLATSSLAEFKYCKFNCCGRSMGAHTLMYILLLLIQHTEYNFCLHVSSDKANEAPIL